ncbi:methenyltetrahydrofolate cyclohydrolase [Piscinibacter sakaiensis]|uniref:Methenyltetrahydrofolate cyclohydrolase n=2 Tax=Piscinibacter sakaiensis TaxID=1547922 RepID=A0A0K8P261_PISS1|nr:methenyltetrahydrofolate cyclohydrolase [Piscinibacter sakaiensis]
MLDTRFLDALASAAPTPGGGGAAALMGATGAALVAMVCHLSLGKKGHEADEPELRRLLDEAEALRAKLQRMVAEDACAFERLMSAYRLPKATAEEQAYRGAAIQNGLRAATLAPLACARAAADAVRLARRAAALGHRQVISDVGVAALAAAAALRSAALNVQINVPALKDRAFADHALTEVAALVDECGGVAEAVHGRVKSMLA